MAELPSGTVTFLFTDLEGSTRLWEDDADAMRVAVPRHDVLLEEAITGQGGVVFSRMGDGMAAAFGSAPEGIAAAVDAQLALSAEAWGGIGPLRARMGLHAGEGTVVGGQYDSQPLNRCARLMAVAHGGQVLVSDAVEVLARGLLPQDVGLVDLGEHRLRDLAQPMRVFQVMHPRLADRFPALRSLDAFLGNLPLQVSSLVGRDQEIARTIDALDRAWVVTLTGVGGVGKTRLAYQVAAEVLPRFRDGAWLVELAPVRDPDDVADAFAAVFGVTARTDETIGQAVVEFLRSKQLLLVVDNCEHLLEAVADLLDVIERSCPRVVVLATSREGLALEGEQMLAVPSLRPPADDSDPDAIARSDAVRLFVERAQAADADFTLDAGNVAVVAQVCRRLDGVPLAIELAAARITTMSPTELATALDRRFEVLAGGRRRAVKRHQTLRATIDWSYDLLDEPHQRLLARLSVFAGGCTRDAVQAVCAGNPIELGTAFELLTDLVARSLVVADRTGPDTRYRLLETIREYSEERLAEHDETMQLRDRHARYFIEHGRVMCEGLYGPEQVTWGHRLRAEHENLLAAMTHAIDTENVDLAMGLLMTAGWGHALATDLSMRVDSVLALPGAREHTGYPYALGIAAFWAASRGEYSLAEELADAATAAEQAQGIPSPSVIPLELLVGMSHTNFAISRSAWSEAAERANETAQRGRAHELAGVVATGLGAAAALMTFGGEDAAAIPIATEALEFARAARMPKTIAYTLRSLAVALADREPDQARALFDEALGLYETLGYDQVPDIVGMTLAAARLADWDQTARLVSPAIRRLHWIGERPILAGMFNVSARVLANTNPEAAAVLQGASRTLAQGVTTSPSTDRLPRSADVPTGFFIEMRRETTRQLDDTLGEHRRRELQAQGTTLQYDDAVAYALAHLDKLLALDEP